MTDISPAALKAWALDEAFGLSNHARMVSDDRARKYGESRAATFRAVAALAEREMAFRDGNKPAPPQEG